VIHVASCGEKADQLDWFVVMVRVCAVPSRGSVRAVAESSRVASSTSL
jgi:hypothetical protein